MTATRVPVDATRLRERLDDSLRRGVAHPDFDKLHDPDGASLGRREESVSSSVAARPAARVEGRVPRFAAA